ncbi:MAG: hypothetical protein ISR99_00480 [Parcubacteria group bacterium]|nr:hypothetical protein [Parcubacteria group bacterium]
MVKKILNLLHQEIRGLHEAAYLLGVFALLSAVLGLVRDRVLAHLFGAGTTLDVYYAAFRVPDLLFVGIASLVSVYALIPFITQKDSESDRRRFIGSIFGAFTLVMALAGIAFYFIMPKFLSLSFPSLLSGEHGSDFVLLSQILLLQPILLGLSNIFASVTQVYGRFILYALGPVLYNIGTVIGALFLYEPFGLLGLGYGVLLGALMHLGIQLPFIYAHKFLSKLTFRINLKEIWGVVTLSLPRTIALSARSISFFVLVAFAALMTKGSVTIFNLSIHLHEVPLAIIGASYSVAAFPTLARLFSNGSRGEFFEHILVATRHIIFWATPVIVIFIVLRAQIVRVAFGSGAFDWSDTRLTAAAFAIFIIALATESLGLLFTRGFYAAGKTKIPLVTNVVTAIATVVFAYILVRIFENYLPFQSFVEGLLRVEGIEGTSILMLPLGYSIASFINIALLWYMFGREFKSLTGSVSTMFFQVLTASILMGASAHIALNLLDDVFDLNTFWGIFLQGLLAGFAGLFVLIVSLKMLNNKEIGEVWVSIRKKFWRASTVSADQSDLL